MQLFKHLSQKDDPSPLEKAIAPACRRWQKAVRKWKHWKLYFFLFITLPLFIVSLIVKVTETLVRIKLRESAFAVPMETAPAPGEPETSQTDRETKEKPIPIPVKLERVTFKKPGVDTRG